MKISFAGVFLDHVIDRLGAMTVASSYFRSSKVGPTAARIVGYDIELDPETGLVTVAAENDHGAAVIVPLERVKRFEIFPSPKVADRADDDAADDDAADDHAGIDAPAVPDDHDGDDAPGSTPPPAPGSTPPPAPGSTAPPAPGSTPAPESTPALGTLLPSEPSELTPKPLRRLGR